MAPLITKERFAEINNQIFSYILLTFRSLCDVACSDECPDEEALQYTYRMLPLFRAIMKFCSTNRLPVFDIYWLSLIRKSEITIIDRNMPCYALACLLAVKNC